MQLKHAMMVLLLLLIATAAWAQPCESVVVTDHHLTLTDPSGTRTVVDDPRGIDLPRFSPSRNAIAYVRTFRFRDGEPLSKIVVVDRAGHTVAEIPIAENHGINAVMSLGWLSDDRLWTEGHVNPSTSIYHEWDIHSARSEREVWGTGFAPSADGKSLAYVAFVPHGAPAPHDSSRVMVDDSVVYPNDDDAARHVVRNIVWSGQSLVFADEVAGRASVVLLNPHTRKIDAKVPLSAMPANIAPGDAPDTVHVVVGSKSMRVDLRSGTVTPLSQLRKSAANSVPCPQ